MTQSAADGPINLTDDQLDKVVGGVISNPTSPADHQRNALENDIFALIQANPGKSNDTVLLAAGSKEAQELTTRMWGQPDLNFDINEAAKNGFTKGELSKLLEGMSFVDATINQRGGSQVTKRDGLESELWTLINQHGGKSGDTVIVAPDSAQFRELTLKLTPHLDTAPNLAEFSRNGFTKDELTRIAQEMEMTDSMLSQRGIRTGQ